MGYLLFTFSFPTEYFLILFQIFVLLFEPEYLKGIYPLSPILFLWFCTVLSYFCNIYFRALFPRLFYFLVYLHCLDITCLQSTLAHEKP